MGNLDANSENIWQCEEKEPRSIALYGTAHRGARLASTNQLGFNSRGSLSFSVHWFIQFDHSRTMSYRDDTVLCFVSKSSLQSVNRGLRKRSELDACYRIITSQ